ncbi:MAG: hypothetical protein GX594_02640 [Pirellulaceae bacterium]|nr:hypothetical protein [Pirellulaceae bacterium]
MDKLRPTIEAIKKYHFWVLCGALVLTVLVCWWMSTSGMAEQFNTQESKIKNAFSGVQGIQSGHPNQRTIDEIKKRDAELKQNVFEAWEVLYKEQKEKNPFPTEELGEDFQRQFETLRPQEELARRYRERYQNFIKERLPKLKKMIDALHPIEPEGDEAAGVPAAAGLAKGGELGGVGRIGGAEAEWVGVVEWLDADYAKLESKFFWQQAPTTLAVVHAQEDLWVYEALLRVIKNTNEGATNQNNAIVKRIEAIDIGSDAVAAWQSAENALGLQTTERTGGPGMQGGDMGGENLGGPGRTETGGTPEEQLNRQIMDLRYIDDKGKPLPYQPQYPHANHPYSEFKMMPISMRLVMDQRHIPRLLVWCANSNMPIEVRRVRLLKGAAPANTGSSTGSPSTRGGEFGGIPGGGRSMGGMEGPGGMGGMTGMGGMGGYRPSPMRGTEGQDSETGTHDVPIEIHAIINIYNPPDRDKLGKGAASTGPAEGAPPAPQDATLQE